MAKTPEAPKGLSRKGLAKAIEDAPDGSSAKRAGEKLRSKIRSGERLRAVGAVVAGLAVADLMAFGTAAWAAAHVAFLPGALAIDGAIALGAGAVAIYGAAKKRRHKSRRERVSSLQELVKPKKITQTRGNRQGEILVVPEWHRDPVRAADGGIDEGTGWRGEIRPVSVKGVLHSRSVKFGASRYFEGAAFGEEPHGNGLQPVGESKSWSQMTSRFISHGEGRTAFKFGERDIPVFVGGEGWNGQAQRGVWRRAVVGSLLPAEGYFLQVDGNKATIFRRGANFDNDPTDVIVHDSMTVRSWGGDPDKARKLAMRALRRGTAWRGKNGWWHHGTHEGTPVFGVWGIGRVGTWLRRSPVYKHTGWVDAYDTEEVRVVETPGVRRTRDRRQAAVEQAAALELTAATQRAEAERVAIEAARLHMPPLRGDGDYSSGLISTVRTMADAESPTVGNDYVIGTPTTVVQDGSYSTETSTVHIFTGQERPAEGRRADSIVQTSITIRPNHQGETGRHISEFAITVWSRRENPGEGESEYERRIFTYNPVTGHIDPEQGQEHSAEGMRMLTSALSAVLHPQQGTVAAS